MYEFIDVEIEGGLKAGKTDTFDEVKKIVKEKAIEGWELVQIIPVFNEKWSSGQLVMSTIVFKVNK